MVMRKIWFAVLFMALWCGAGMIPGSLAQQTSGQPPSSDKQAEEKAALEAKAVVLLEQVVAESASLRLPENRIRLQIAAADLLWPHAEAQARGLFDLASAGIIELQTKTMGPDNRQNFNGRQNFSPYNQNRGSAIQLRQELVMAVARHNAALAYQILNATQPPPMPADQANNRLANVEANLEKQLLNQIALTDPLLAMKNAEAMLDKGQYSSSFSQVLGQLQQKDKEAAAKFSDRLLKRLQSENLLSNQDANLLILSLLRPGPRPAEKSGESARGVIPGGAQILNETAYVNLLEAMIAAALKANVPAPGGRGMNMGGGRPNGFRGGGNPPQPAQDSAAAEQVAGRILLGGLESLLPQIDRYLPARASAVRQKLTQMGMDTSQRPPYNQISELMAQGTSESYLSAAASAPAGMQTSLYQRAALKALEEGNPERARQIASERLSGAQRSSLLQRIEAQQLAVKSGDEAIDSIRQGLARLSSDEERLRMLLQIASTTQKENAKLALQILGEAQKLVSGRITNYQQFESQLQVARAFAPLDPARSFELLEPGINQLNELFPAAALLSGFDVTIFKDGELPFQEGSRLSSMVNQYAQELASLAKSDFERAQMTAERFTLPEARIFTRLAIVRGVLGSQAAGSRFGSPAGIPPMTAPRRP
jgi:hypothetical protein